MYKQGEEDDIQREDFLQINFLCDRRKEREPISHVDRDIYVERYSSSLRTRFRDRILKEAMGRLFCSKKRKQQTNNKKDFLQICGIFLSC